MKRQLKITLIVVLSIIVAISVSIGSYAFVARVIFKQSMRDFTVEIILRTALLPSRIMSEKAHNRALYSRYQKRNSNYEVPSYVERLLNAEIEQLDAYPEFPLVVFNGDSTDDDVIFYLHGGGYCEQPLPFHYIFANNLSKTTGSKVILPVYPKIPDNYVMDNLNYVYDVYKGIVTEYADKNVHFMGDSAGGGLCYSLCTYIDQRGELDMPQNIITFSPWVDVSMSNPALKDYDLQDPMLCSTQIKVWGHCYAQFFDGEKYVVQTQNPLASPTYADLTIMPQSYVFVGTHEVLYPDLMDFDQKFEQGKNQLFIYEGLCHTFPLFPIKEQGEVIEIVADIIE